MDTFEDPMEIILWTRHADGRWSARTLWMVRVDERAYVRSAFGRRSAWYRRVLGRADARIEAASGRLPVVLRPVSDAGLVQRVSDAYRAKYGLCWPGPVASVNGPEAAATTLWLTDAGQVAQLPA
ncbi:MULTISPECIES: DUF2255 family protein [Streptomyces]|uniref:DUF2255 family protein n=1 Tax=Streptomyces TaxID=1883 RepID=UPI000F6B9FB9|nr:MULTISPECIES: DUF2255 family protein [unclassified Streptomyces]AZM87208.1 DUF2255 family protein [Streptomyces sp. W1SF4]RSS63419.1 DUF2255 family protein [Streptomyces sp. WAC07061]